MSVGFLLLVIFGLVALVVVGMIVVGYLNGGDARAEIREAKQETVAVKQREKIATKALRAIVNGAGNPVYEAQDALDQIEGTYTKELN